MMRSIVGIVAVFTSGLLMFVQLSVAGEGVGRVTTGTPMSTPRSVHTATLLPDGRVLVAGGMVEERQLLDSAELYEPEGATFSTTGHLLEARVGHTATLLPDGRVLVVGGWGRNILASAELYENGVFIETGSMTTPRGAFTATLLNDGRVLVMGGYDNRQTLASAEIYDPATGQFSLTGTMQRARASHTATLLPDGWVLVVGGGDGRMVLSEAEIYDPATGEFTPAGEMQMARHKHGAVLLQSGEVLILGGSDLRDWRGRYTSAEMYEPEQGTFAMAAHMDAARFKLGDAIALLENGEVVVAGGSADAARFFSSATRLANGSVLIAGGYDTNIASTDATRLRRAALLPSFGAAEPACIRPDEMD